jgi:hypothetical protein
VVLPKYSCMCTGLLVELWERLGQKLCAFEISVEIATLTTLLNFKLLSEENSFISLPNSCPDLTHVQALT